MIGIQDSTTNHFGSLIRSGGKYIIPKFQRDYSWDMEQWDDLWQDIESMIAEKGEHYMGYLVLQTLNGKDCLIIDGQQRITSLSSYFVLYIQNLSMEMMLKRMRDDLAAYLKKEGHYGY